MKDTTATGDGDDRYQSTNSALLAKMIATNKRMEEEATTLEGASKKEGSSTTVKNNNPTEDMTMSANAKPTKPLSKLVIPSNNNLKFGGGK